MNAYTPELSLLLALARIEPSEQAESLICDNASTLDWALLVQTAYDHGVTGLLCNSLVNIPSPLIPDEISQAAHEHLRQQRTKNQQLANQLTRILTELASSGIRAIPFKGPTLATAAYGDLALRTFRDLDFLIHKAQIQFCLDRLNEIGYRQNVYLSPKQMEAFLNYSGQDILYGEGSPVEPHWTFAPITWALEIDYQGIWDRSKERTFNGQRILCLAPEDELIILCVHGSKEKWTKLKWVADVNEFIRSHPDLAWEKLLTRARSQGLTRMVLLGLGLAEQLLEAPLPETVNRSMKEERHSLHWCEEIARQFFNVAERGESIYALSRFHWAMRERWSDRWRYVWRTVTQPREHHFMALTLPDSLFLLYTPYKLLHDYLALPIWLLLKKLHRHSATIDKSTEPEHTDATR